MIARLKSKKNPSVSILRDWQLQEYIARERILNPSLFLASKQHKRYVEKFEYLPAYLNNEPEVILHERHVIANVSLTNNEAKELKSFVVDLGIMAVEEDEEGDGLVFYDRFVLNGMSVRTEASEAQMKTMDSLVCARFTVGESDDSDEDAEVGRNEDLVFGHVRHILKYHDELLVCAGWFENIQGKVTDDQRAGLDKIPVQRRRRGRAFNDWVRACDLALQKHLRVGGPYDGTFSIIIKI